MYNPYQYNYQPQQNFMQPWGQQQTNQWQQPAPAPTPEPVTPPMMPATSEIAQAIHRLCDILEAREKKGG